MEFVYIFEARQTKQQTKHFFLEARSGEKRGDHSPEKRCPGQARTTHSRWRGWDLEIRGWRRIFLDTCVKSQPLFLPCSLTVFPEDCCSSPWNSLYCFKTQLLILPAPAITQRPHERSPVSRQCLAELVLELCCAWVRWARDGSSERWPRLVSVLISKTVETMPNLLLRKAMFQYLPGNTRLRSPCSGFVHRHYVSTWCRFIRGDLVSLRQS